jgi:allantoicase
MQHDFTKLQNVAAANFGAKALYCTDDFFAEMENLLKSGRGIFIADKYTERGKWMDGWESRRKRTEGHDYCIIQLGAESQIAGFDIDTNFFLGNHPPFAKIEACNLPPNASTEDAKNQSQWDEVIAKMPLNAGSQHFVAIAPAFANKSYTHVKLHIYPDGGVARLKVYGKVVVDWTSRKEETLDLASANFGAKAVVCNDMFFSHMDNLLMPFRGANMGDGWETKRNRTPNNRDWIVVQLAHKGTINSVLIDTRHFKGNYPDTFSLDGICSDEAIDITLENVNALPWLPILDKQKLEADTEHAYSLEGTAHENKAFTHVRLNIFPDGGVSRLRLFGKIG